MKSGIAALIALMLTACSGDDGLSKARDELIQALTRVDPSASLGERKVALDRLQAMKLTHQSLRDVRERCLQVHRGLLSAEVEQAAARQALERAQELDAGVPASEKLRIVGLIKASTQALEGAQEGFPDCQRRMRDLMREAP